MLYVPERYLNLAESQSEGLLICIRKWKKTKRHHEATFYFIEKDKDTGKRRAKPIPFDDDFKLYF